jgi:hypothetical protein
MNSALMTSAGLAIVLSAFVLYRKKWKRVLENNSFL